jgi:hypothetical protein
MHRASFEKRKTLKNLRVKIKKKGLKPVQILPQSGTSSRFDFESQPQGSRAATKLKRMGWAFIDAFSWLLPSCLGNTRHLNQGVELCIQENGF